jgi:hypothetical protein
MLSKWLARLDAAIVWFIDNVCEQAAQWPLALCETIDDEVSGWIERREPPQHNTKRRA